MRSRESRVVGMVGCDFSGSTILSAVLDGLDGVHSVGETHWIVDRGLHCRECCPGDNKCMWDSDCECGFDADCPVFTKKVLEDLRAIPEGDRRDRWWVTIAEAADARVIISSDKRPSHFEKLGLPDSYIFTFKNPVAHVFSRAKRQSKEFGYGRISNEIVEEAIGWLTFNAGFRIDFLFDNARRLAVVENEAFSADPQRALSESARFLGVDPDPAALYYWDHDHHYIGGNFSVRQKVAANDVQHVVGLDRSYESVLTGEQRDLITRDSRISSMLDRIQKLTELPGAVQI